MQPECHANSCAVSLLEDRRRWFAALMSAVFGLMALVGCQQPPPPIDPKPFEGVTLHVVVPNAPIVRALLLRHGNVWTEFSGAKVELSASSDRGDLVLFPPAELAKLAANAQLAPLPDSIRDQKSRFDFSNFLRPYRNYLSTWDNHAYALPVLGDSLVCVYRADLLDAPAHRRAINKRLSRPLSAGGPASWQDVEVIASYFHQTPVWSEGDAANGPRSSLPALPENPNELDRLFHVLAVTFVRQAVTEERLGTLEPETRKPLLYDYPFDSGTGEARIADAGFIEALSLLQRLTPFRSAKKGESSADAFATGRAVIALVSLADLAGMQRAAQKSNMRLGICRVPGSSVYYDGQQQKSSEMAGNVMPYVGAGGWLAGLSAHAPHEEAALDFLSYLTGATASLEVLFEASWGGGPTRITHFDINNRAGWFNYDLSAAQTDQLLLAVKQGIDPSIANPVYRLRIPEERAYAHALGEQLRAALDGNKPAAAALKDAARRWDEMTASIGKEKHLRDYRMSLGLR